VDVQAFAMGCVAIAQYRLATRRTGDDAVKRKLAVDDKGNTITDEDGKPVYAGEHINPWALVQSMTFKQAMLVFDKFGMTPQARTRIAIQPQGDLFGSEKTGAASYF
jgi:phage terminase small subunit